MSGSSPYEVLMQRRSRAASRRSTAFWEEPTSVYVIRAEGLAVFKVGISKAPQRRLTNLRTATPFRLELLITSEPVERMVARYYEERIHADLSRWSVGGEWFACDLDKVCAAIAASGVDLPEAI